jgi:hypothetical protein
MTTATVELSHDAERLVSVEADGRHCVRDCGWLSWQTRAYSSFTSAMPSRRSFARLEGRTASPSPAVEPASSRSAQCRWKAASG